MGNSLREENVKKGCPEIKIEAEVLTKKVNKSISDQRTKIKKSSKGLKMQSFSYNSFSKKTKTKNVRKSFNISKNSIKTSKVTVYKDGSKKSRKEKQIGCKKIIKEENK